MPLLKEWNVGPYGTAAIWKVEEPEAFFSEATGLTSDIKSDQRRIEFFAGRYLLRQLEEDFPLHTIAKDEHDKPRIHKNKFFFSISHSWPYIAVVIDPFEEAGIDIQVWHPRITTIQHKFLAADEQELFQNDPKLLTLAWSAKEAVYKWNGRRGVDFIQHLPISWFDNHPNGYGMTIYFKKDPVPQMIYVDNIMTEDFACAYVAKAQDWAIY